MTTELYNKILYDSPMEPFNGYDAALHSLKVEKEVVARWRSEKLNQSFWRKLTFGFSDYFQSKLVSEKELHERIHQYRDASYEIERVVGNLQRICAKWLYDEPRSTSRNMQELKKPQIGSMLGQAASVLIVWAKKRTIDASSGMRGQIIWERARQLSDKLKEEGYFVFFHAHSYPITLHLELSSHFQSIHQSRWFKILKPLESRRKFRPSETADLRIENTTEYLKSPMGRAINSEVSMDNHYRDRILSCDAIPDNNYPFESAQHFFKSNISIVETKSSTGLGHEIFDLNFIQRYLTNPFFQKRAVQLFSEAREKLKNLPDYGMIRVIAIEQNTLRNEKTNYAWRSHPFGRICTCSHSSGKRGHAEFAETLEQHQKGKYQKCSGGYWPQYRMLTGNLDRDTTKQIYTMDCFTEKEKKTYFDIYEHLKSELSSLFFFEQFKHCKNYEQMLEILKGLNPKAASSDYCHGAKNILQENQELLIDFMDRLKRDLSENQVNFILESIGQIPA